MAKEEKEIQSEGEQIAQVMGMPGWDLIEAEFEKEIMDLQSIQNIDDSSADAALADMKARNMSVKKMMAWWRKIHGKVERKAFNKKNSPEESHIRHYDDDED